VTTVAATARVAETSDVTVSTTVTDVEWDRYLGGHQDATVDHLWAWRRVFEGVFGHRCVYLAARRGHAIVGVVPLVLVRSRLFGRCVTSLPFLNYGGIVADDSTAVAALTEASASVARSFRASHLELRHRCRQLNDAPYRSHKVGLTMPLPATVQDLWQQTDRKVRNQVRKAQKEGLHAAAGGLELVQPFYEVFAENMRDLGTPVYPSRLFEETLRAFPEQARVVVVRQGTKTVAGAVAVGWRGTVLVPWASALRGYRALCPNMLLYWTLMELAVAAGAQTFDFGRSSPGSGPHQFKRQWGGRETPLAWEYVILSGQTLPDQGPSNPTFRLAIEAWKRLPLRVANRLGPWIAGSLP
jgi:FemAB-related protein (PEP-CTERM system-associated)